MSSTQGRGPVALLGQRLFGHGAIYVFGAGLGMALALVRVVVLTRLLEISVYGQLTLLLLAAGFVTMFCRAVFITGTIRSVFRGGDEGDELPTEEPESAAPREEQATALATGFAASLLLTALLTAGVAVFADPIDRALIGSGSGAAVIFATALGGIGATFYLVSALARFERRPVAFVSLQLLHGVLGLGVALLAIEAGFGLDGAIAGLMLGSLLSLLPSMFVSRHRFARAVDPAIAGALIRLGLPYLGVIAGFWMLRNADLFMASRFLDHSDVGIYQVAGRVGGLAAALVGGVIIAWGPLMLGPLRGALHRGGRIGDASARMLTYFWFAALWIALGLFLLQDQLVRIAPSAYGNAAPLIPLIGISALATSLMLIVYRTSLMAGKLPWLSRFSITMPIVLVGLALVLIPAFGLYGAAASAIAAPSLGAAGFLTVSQRSGAGLDLPWSRMLLAAVIAVTMGGLATLASSAVGAAAAIVSAAGVSLFPVILVAFGVVPPQEARTLAGLVPTPQRAKPSAELGGLTPKQLNMLALLLREGRGAAYVAGAHGRTEAAVMRELVAALRVAAGLGPPKPIDVEIGQFLVESPNVNAGDRAGRILSLDASLDPLEIDRLSQTARSISSLKPRRWRELTLEAADWMAAPPQ